MSTNLPIPAEFAEIAAICVASEMTIGNSLVLGVDGRALHAGLQVGTKVATWADRRIKSLGLERGIDFEVFPKSGKNPNGGRPEDDYVFTLDAAKHIAMVEKNERGKLVRGYFLWCEKKAFTDQPSVSVAEIERRMMQALGGMMKGILNKQVTPKIEQLSQKVDGVLAVRPIGVAVTTSRTALGWLEHYGVVKRKKGMSHKVSNALKRLSFQMGYVISKTSEEKKLCFHEIVANAYFTVGAGRHLLPKAVKGQKEMGLESTPVPFSQTPA
ncbi:antA/AntB antirepressor family protein [Acetobacter okinawensis]|uniref:antA/AntB antirepressor family protein n=1 Tax=Acetobacter okinawensis TaxID=1076594 RepID=UPI001BA59E4E|nr:antA/AntB antirepressor family protein [Acetobacter okinawensis]MBS0966211.1 antA/AntB antirepressor family protein [Acetobacter okinawensis]